MKIIKALLIVLVPMLTLAQDIERAEPPFRWVDMQNTELQVMLYGENIAWLKPVIGYEGVTIKRTVTVENPNYQFIYLEIGKDTKLENNRTTLIKTK